MLRKEKKQKQLSVIRNWSTTTGTDRISERPKALYTHGKHGQQFKLRNKLDFSQI